MPNTNEKKQAGRDQGNAIENETRGTDPIEEIIRRHAESSVSEEEKLAEEHPDGGESGGKKY